MIAPTRDDRSAEQRAQDDVIASEPRLPPLTLPPDARPLPMEVYLARRRHPVAFAGIVENGVVRPLDASVKLPEHSCVMIVTSE